MRKASVQPGPQVPEPGQALAALIDLAVILTGQMAGRVTVMAVQVGQARQLAFAHLDHGLGLQASDECHRRGPRGHKFPRRTVLAESAADLLGQVVKHL